MKRKNSFLGVTHGSRCLGTLAVWVGAALSAQAQDGKAELTSADGTQATETQEAQDGRKQQASQHFFRAVELFNDEDYSAALFEFNLAYQIAPNYRVLYNIGLCQLELHDYADAKKSLEQYLAQGGDELGNARREIVSKKLRQLDNRTGYLSVKSNVKSAEVVIDDETVALTPVAEPILVNLGRHRITLRKRGYVEESKVGQVAAGSLVTLVFELEEVPETKVVIRDSGPQVDHELRKLNIRLWTTVAAGGLLVVGAATALGLAQRANAQALDASKQVPADIELTQSKTDQKRRLAFSGYGLMAAAGVAAGVAVLFGVKRRNHLMSKKAGKSKASPQAAVRHSLRPTPSGFALQF